MDPKKLSTQELVQLCLSSQDQAPWAEFVRRFQPTISGVVRKRLRRWATPDPAVVDDLTQDTFLKLCANNYRALREFKFEHENAFYGFLKTIASNVVEDYIRSINNAKRGGRLKREDLEEVSITTPAPATVSERAEHRVLISEVKRCLDKQRDDPNFPRDSAIFWLYFQQGLTAKAISELPSIDLEVKGVESALLRLTRLVRAELGEKPGHRIASGR